MDKRFERVSFFVHQQAAIAFYAYPNKDDTIEEMKKHEPFPTEFLTKEKAK